MGRKIGMTQIFDNKGCMVPVTVLEVGPCVVLGIKTLDKNGYSAVQLGFVDVNEKSLNRSTVGFFKKNNIVTKKSISEFRVGNEEILNFNVGQVVGVDVFKPGDYVDVTARTKGKGYAGVIKRHNFGMQPTTHGQSDRTRSRGSSGAQGPQKLFKGTRMSGHLGNDSVTVQNLLVMNVDVEKNILLIKGSVPGNKKGVLSLSKCRN
jgi:large subunit ribosomal protein L3